jgi:putative FmdB family regulatory protein
VRLVPIYEYRCKSCDNIFERLELTKVESPTCKECGKPVERVISRCSFRLAGSGWYKTDYATKGADSDATPQSKQTR